MSANFYLFFQVVQRPCDIRYLKLFVDSSGKVRLPVTIL